jgi:hypothetical protein
VSAAIPTWLDRQLNKSRLDDQTVLEFKLMFACAEVLLKNSGAPDPRHLAGLIAHHSPDWRNFLDLLHENRFLPVACRALHALRGLGDVDSLSNAVRERWKRDSVHMLKMTAELVRLVKKLSDNAIRVIAFKGPALAMQVHNAANMRLCKDLDLLVAPEDHERAERVLLQEGYSYPLGEIPFKASLRRRLASSHTRMIHWENRTEVELHFDLMHEVFPSVWPFDVLWRERASVPIADTAVPTLSLPLHGLYLCLHGEKHSWERLIRPYDIAAVVDAMGQGGATDLMALAEHYGQKTRLMKSLLLAHLLFGLKIPETPMRIMSDRRVRIYMELALQMIVAPRGRRYWLIKRVRWAACATAREKWRYLAAHFLPEDVDIARAPLPKQLFSLHSFLKPFWTFRRKLDGPDKRPR